MSTSALLRRSKTIQPWRATVYAAVFHLNEFIIVNLQFTWRAVREGLEQRAVCPLSNNAITRRRWTNDEENDYLITMHVCMSYCQALIVRVCACVCACV